MSWTKPIFTVVSTSAILLAGVTAWADNTPHLAPPQPQARPVVAQPAPQVASQTPAGAAKATDAPQTIEIASEPVTERYSNGNVKIERHVAQDASGNYVNHGTYTMYDSDGKVLRNGEFLSGKQCGKWTQNFAKDEGSLLATGQEKEFAGPFVSEASFIEGKLDGVWTIKDHNGQTVAEWNFEQGVRNGEWTWYYANGQKRLQAHYVNGALNGEVLEWDRDGKQTSQSTYIDGKYLAKVVGWYELGQKHYEGYYLRAPNLPEPAYDWWTSTAKPAPSRTPAKDMQHGIWTAWYRNGNKMTEGQYDHGIPTGQFTWWFENGQKQAEAEYQGGRKNGTWTTWHANGLKESQGEFQSGVLVGKWTRWTDDGKLVEVQDGTKSRPQQTPKTPAARTSERTPLMYRNR